MRLPVPPSSMATAPRYRTTPPVGDARSIAAGTSSAPQTMPAPQTPMKFNSRTISKSPFAASRTKSATADNQNHYQDPGIMLGNVSSNKKLEMFLVQERVDCFDRQKYLTKCPDRALGHLYPEDAYVIVCTVTQKNKSTKPNDSTENKNQVSNIRRRQ
jgi:hypothetical protein